MANLSPRPYRRNRNHFRSLDVAWSRVCAAYAQSADYRAGNNAAFSRALADFERQFCPENLNSGAVIIDFRKGRSRR